MSPKRSAQPKTIYICDQCGAQYPRWQGQCDQCQQWNTLVETVVAPAAMSGGGRAVASTVYGTSGDVVVSASAVLAQGASVTQRLSTGMYELDRVLGGGIVFGSAVLLGGEPGIGKSTIITQMLIKVLNNEQKIKALYAAGEESPQQIGQRIQRMMSDGDKQKSSWQDRLFFFSGANVDVLVEQIRSSKPDMVVVDSIQTLVTDELSGMPGSVGQLREVTARIVSLAKQLNIPMFLIGHVTKEGDIAGPKVLEHIVDTVIQINGERTDEIRILRSLKNRFGPTDEVGLFRLTSDGAAEVSNPGEVFLEEKTLGQPGSALALVLEGSRPMVVEVQALVVSTFLPSPRRVSRGINVSKLHLLLAVLQKHAGIDCSSYDVYVNVVGSLDIKDPGIDLAVAAALVSAKTEKSLGQNSVYCGEIGLLGEIRKVVGLEKRQKEAKRLGYSPIITAQNMKHVQELRRVRGGDGGKVSNDSEASKASKVSKANVANG